jgi:Protein of unknown function (DUF445)
VLYRFEIGAYIERVVRDWDSTTLVDRLELQVGEDLQYIRINGPLVGGLVGLAIFIASKWIAESDRTVGAIGVPRRASGFGDRPRKRKWRGPLLSREYASAVRFPAPKRLLSFQCWNPTHDRHFDVKLARHTRSLGACRQSAFRVTDVGERSIISTLAHQLVRRCGRATSPPSKENIQ